ncbi:hypothetical protein CDAR_398471 [Caerostris darwini]|uniref:Uncharacterized protein n=1 Tax=Caerostris darwini TaxID=1538125 RepID=A0AAV4VEE8_9ARAC|nr:hypothetical protein CDAR_398471 [Caerostris darwini]
MNPFLKRYECVVRAALPHRRPPIAKRKTTVQRHLSNSASNLNVGRASARHETKTHQMTRRAALMKTSPSPREAAVPLTHFSDPQGAHGKDAVGDAPSGSPMREVPDVRTSPARRHSKDFVGGRKKKIMNWKQHSADVVFLSAHSFVGEVGFFFYHRSCGVK